MASTTAAPFWKTLLHVEKDHGYTPGGCYLASMEDIHASLHTTAAADHSHAEGTA